MEIDAMRRLLFTTPVLVLLTGLIFVMAGNARADAFQACGVIVQIDECTLFVPDFNPSFKLTLDDYGDFPVGDSVCVIGDLVMDCDSACGPAVGCVYNAVLESDTIFYFPFQGYGVLQQGTGCLVFDPGGVYELFSLDNYGDFGAGDTVFVRGWTSWEIPSGCPEAEGHIYYNTITLANLPGVPVPGNIVLQLEEGVQLDSVIAELDIQILDSIANRNLYLVDLVDTTTMDSVFQFLWANPLVKFAEMNLESGSPEVLQMSMSFPDEYAPPLDVDYSPEDYYNQNALEAVGRDSALSMADGSGKVVAIIDNGLDYDHPLMNYVDFKAGYDFYNEDADPCEDSGTALGHGTFIAGLVNLIAPGSEIMPIKALNENGVGSTFDLAEAIYYAVDSGAHVINMSFGMSDYTELIANACSSAVSSGIAIVAAGGNSARDVPIYPAALPQVIAVSSVDSLDQPAEFTNYGAFIDICAPGVDLYSSLAGEYDWGNWSGTSFSAALATAACALLLEVNPDLTPQEIEILLRMTAETNLQSGTIFPPDPYYAFGRLDVAQAVTSASGSGQPGDCGDANSDGLVDVSDAVFIINYAFIPGSPVPDPLESADTNCDQTVDISDAIALISFAFASQDICCP